MTISVTEYKGTLLGIFFILMYFMWMDVALYYHIQAREPAVPEPVSKDHDGDHHYQGLFSPFNGLTVKMMMIDPANHYIHTPAAVIFNEVLHFSTTFTFITPNMISISHVLVAMVAARFFASESLLMRQVGVAIFEVRTFLDCLDGVVYRARAHQGANISNFGSIGYIVDGIADTLGSVALLFGCYLYLRRHHVRRGYSKLSLATCENGSSPTSSPVGHGNGVPITHRRIMGVLACFGLQLAISAWFWDRYIAGYHDLLESPQASEQQVILQNEVLKSALMWIIMWFWRICNAHALLEMVLFSIFVDRLWEFLVFIQYIGFMVLFVLVSLTEVHFHDVTNYIGKLAVTLKTMNPQPT